MGLIRLSVRFENDKDLADLKEYLEEKYGILFQERTLQDRWNAKLQITFFTFHANGGANGGE